MGIQILDLELGPNDQFEHILPPILDNCLVFVYEGGCIMCGQRLAHHDTARFDAADPSRRKLILATGKQGVGMMIFSGMRINEPIAWHGPFVMNTKAELRKGFADYQAGKFPYKRCSFDYRKAKGAQRAILCFVCLKCWLQRASARWAWTIFWCSTRVCLVQHNQSCDVSPGTKMGRYCVAFQGVCSGCLATPSK